MAWSTSSRLRHSRSGFIIINFLNLPFTRGLGVRNVSPEVILEGLPVADQITLSSVERQRRLQARACLLAENRTQNRGSTQGRSLSWGLSNLWQTLENPCWCSSFGLHLPLFSRLFTSQLNTTAVKSPRSWIICNPALNTLDYCYFIILTPFSSSFFSSGRLLTFPSRGNVWFTTDSNS